MMVRRIVLALAVLAPILMTAACQPAPLPAPAPQVALWAVSDGHAPRGWILGTIHALPPGTQWRRASIDAAMTTADRLVMEIGDPVTPAAAGAALTRLALTPGLPLPADRLDAPAKDALLRAFQKLKLNDAQFRDQESWAVALQLSALASQRAGANAADGVEPELRARMPGKPVEGLETIDSQFATFDALAPAAQNRLLADVAREINDPRDGDAQMLNLWLKGDELGLTREANSDFLGDPALHEALLAARNRLWLRRIDTLLRQGAHPFIAVGAAHVVGGDGLPTLLRTRGWTVTRVY